MDVMIILLTNKFGASVIDVNHSCASATFLQRISKQSLRENIQKGLAIIVHSFLLKKELYKF